MANNNTKNNLIFYHFNKNNINLNVAMTRKGLNVIRDKFSFESLTEPVCLSSPLLLIEDKTYNMTEFGFLFSINHHRKRHSKAAKSRTFHMDFTQRKTIVEMYNNTKNS